MDGPGTAIRNRWAAATTGTRLWWSGVGTVALAGLLLVPVAAVAGAAPASGTAQASGAAGAPGATGPSRSGMSGGSGTGTGGDDAGNGAMSGMAGGTGSSGSTTSSSICPNVQGTTVMTNGMVMAPVPSAPPTAQQQAAADQLVASVTQDITQYSDVATAEADGYLPISAARGPMTHYLNKTVAASGDVLDPEHPSALMFADTVDGPVLVGAMFLGASPCQPGPDIGGSLTQWHAHDNLCFAGGQLVGKADAAGTCAVGSEKTSAYFMLHVWTAPQLAAQYQFQADVPASAFAQIDATGRP